MLAYTPAVTSGGSRGHELALTFDDGPGPYTQQLVARARQAARACHVLRDRRGGALLLGRQLAELHSGDVVGDHTETHPMMALLSAHEQHEELARTVARIELLGGPRPRLFRPPYGSFNATTLRVLHRCTC